MPVVESVIKTVLVATAHCIILHIIVVSCCFYDTVISIEATNFSNSLPRSDEPLKILCVWKRSSSESLVSVILAVQCEKMKY